MNDIRFDFQRPEVVCAYPLSSDETIDVAVKEMAEKIADIWIGFMEPEAHSDDAQKKYWKGEIPLYVLDQEVEFPDEGKKQSFKDKFIDKATEMVAGSDNPVFCVSTNYGPEGLLSIILNEVGITKAKYPCVDRYFPCQTSCKLSASTSHSQLNLDLRFRSDI